MEVLSAPRSCYLLQMFLPPEQPREGAGAGRAGTCTRPSGEGAIPTTASLLHFDADEELANDILSLR